MFSLRAAPARGARLASCAQCLRAPRTSTPRSISTQRLSHLTTRPTNKLLKLSFKRPILTSTYSSALSYFTRSYSSSPPATSADEILAQLQDQYATAKDEFEIATEETDKQTTYAEGDREAAREELDKLKGMFEEACGGEFGEEVQRRVGGRIKELDAAVLELERRAIEEH